MKKFALIAAAGALFALPSIANAEDAAAGAAVGAGTGAATGFVVGGPVGAAGEGSKELGAFGEVPLQQGDGKGDGSEGVVEVVGDAAGEGTDALEPL